MGLPNFYNYSIRCCGEGQIFTHCDNSQSKEDHILMIPPWVLSITWAEALFQASFKAPGRICLGLEYLLKAATVSLPLRALTEPAHTCFLSFFFLFLIYRSQPQINFYFYFTYPFSNTFTVFFFLFFPPCPHGSQYFSLHSSPLFNFSTFLRESLPGFAIVFLFFPGLPLFPHSCLHICLLSPFLYFSLQFCISFHKRQPYVALPCPSWLTASVKSFTKKYESPEQQCSGGSGACLLFINLEREKATEKCS